MTRTPWTRAFIILGAAAAFLGCHEQSGSTANAGVDATPNMINAAATRDRGNNASGPAPATAGATTTDFLIGKWSAIGEDCRATIEFRKDGTAVTPIGEAKWTLTGDKLQFDYGDGSKQPPSTVKPLGSDRLQTITESGKKDTQKRC